MTLKLHKSSADIFVPSGAAVDTALAPVTHLAIGAHQDDLEIMAYHGILQGFDHSPPTFAGVTCTNGAGSPRAASYASYTDTEMQQVRRQEQRQAAVVGRYALMAQLDYPSAEVKDLSNRSIVEDLVALMQRCTLDTVYTHNPADKHETHLAVLSATIAALRALPPAKRPKRVLGCEVWRDLDWLPDEDKVLLDVSARPNIAAALIGIFDSQIAGGKRYDLATLGRRLANATYYQSHAVDQAQHVTFALDLTPLMLNTSLTLSEYVRSFLDRFHSTVVSTVTRFDRPA